MQKRTCPSHFLVLQRQYFVEEFILFKMVFDGVFQITYQSSFGRKSAVSGTEGE